MSHRRGKWKWVIHSIPIISKKWMPGSTSHWNIGPLIWCGKRLMKRIRNDRYLLGNQCLKRERGNGEWGNQGKGAVMSQNTFYIEMMFQWANNGLFQSFKLILIPGIIEPHIPCSSLDGLNNWKYNTQEFIAKYLHVILTILLIQFVVTSRGYIHTYTHILSDC